MNSMRKYAGRMLEGAVLVGLLAGTAWLGQLTYHNSVVHGGAETSVHVAPVELPVMSLSGEPGSLTVAGRPLMLLVLSTTCPYCEENMPNWRQLIDDVAALGSAGPEVIVLSVSDGAETVRYLEHHGIDVTAMVVDPSVLELLGLDGYPSTVAVDAGRSLSVWTGVLDTAEQRTVLAWARSAASTLAAANAASADRPSGD